MRSCALRICEAATISMALVLLRVFCTLRILTLISLVPGMTRLEAQARLIGPVLLPVLDRIVQLRFILLGEILGALHPVGYIRVLAFDVVAQGPFRCQRLLDIDVVE